MYPAFLVCMLHILTVFESGREWIKPPNFVGLFWWQLLQCPATLVLLLCRNKVYFVPFYLEVYPGQGLYPVRHLSLSRHLVPAATLRRRHPGNKVIRYKFIGRNCIRVPTDLTKYFSIPLYSILHLCRFVENV